MFTQQSTITVYTNKHTFFYKQHVNLAQPQLCLNILVIEPLSMLKY